MSNFLNTTIEPLSVRQSKKIQRLVNEQKALKAALADNDIEQCSECGEWVRVENLNVCEYGDCKNLTCSSCVVVCRHDENDSETRCPDHGCDKGEECEIRDA